MGYSSKRSFLARRVAHDETLGLHLTVGLLLCIALVGLFALLAAQIEAAQPPQLDYHIYERLRQHCEESPHFWAAVRRITDFGDVPILLPLGVAVVGSLVFRRNWGLAGAWVAIVLLGVVLNDEAKDVFQRPRPLVYVGDISGSSYSFPSGHTMAATISYGLLGYLTLFAFPLRRAMRSAALGCLALLVLVVGFTRMYLSAHWLTDVLGGILLGSAWLALCISLLECGRRHQLAHKNRDSFTPVDGAA
jgi:undecaprenyl-diphosphatase